MAFIKIDPPPADARPRLLTWACSVTLDTPRAYLPCDALGPVSPAAGTTGACAVDAQLDPSLTARPANTASAACKSVAHASMTATRAQGLQLDFSGFSGTANFRRGPSDERAPNDVAKYLDSMSPSQTLPASSPPQRAPLSSSAYPIPSVSSNERAGTASASPRVPLPSTERLIPSRSATRPRTTRARLQRRHQKQQQQNQPSPRSPAPSAPLPPTTPSEERAARGVPAADRARSGSATPSLASVYEARARAAAASAAKGQAAGERTRTCAEGAQSGEDAQSRHRQGGEGGGQGPGDGREGEEQTAPRH